MSMWKRFRQATVAVLISLVMLSCTRDHGAETKGSAGGDYIARVDGRLITIEDMERRIEAVPDYARGIYQGEEGLRNLLDEMVKTEILYLEAKKEGLDRDPAYVTMVNDYRKFALVSLMLDRMVSSHTAVSDREARDYYEKHRESFTMPRQIRASHILVKTESEAEDILRKIRKGVDFKKLARERSIDINTADNGGDVGFFAPGEMSPEFEKVAFSLSKGEVSRPVKSRLGYHIIKVTDIRAKRVLPFSKVRGDIIQRIREEKEQAVFNSYLEKVRGKYEISINEERFREFLDRYAPQATGQNGTVSGRDAP